MHISRRTAITGLGGVLGLGWMSSPRHKALASETSALDSQVQFTRASAPSQLKITDMRIARLKGVPHSSTIIRIDTNEGLSGWGEVRDGASPTYALMLKSRLLGQNPCDVDRLFRKLKQFGAHGRQGGGVSAVEMALWDLAGKAYGVPVYQLLGGKFRDRIRLYADTRQVTPEFKKDRLSGTAMGRVLKERMDRGLTWLKFDLGIDLLRDHPGSLSQPFSRQEGPDPLTPHAFNGIEITPKGIDLMAGYLSDVREVTGMEIPLAIDHLGQISPSSAIRLAKAFEPFALSWIEDPLPWNYPQPLKELTLSSTTPILTGEDIYLKEEFRTLVEGGIVDMIQPDIGTAGGLLETKKIGDLAEERGIPMVIHCASTPIQFMASVHVAAATQNVLCLEHHALDIPWWESLGLGLPQPLIQQGFVEVPTTPGLGVELNEDVAREHLETPGFFEPTPEWNVERAWDRTWS